VVELTSPPELPHARVNKCLIALVSKKIVQKVNEGVSTVFILFSSVLRKNGRDEREGGKDAFGYRRRRPLLTNISF